MRVSLTLFISLILSKCYTTVYAGEDVWEKRLVAYFVNNQAPAIMSLQHSTVCNMVYKTAYNVVYNIVYDTYSV